VIAVNEVKPPRRSSACSSPSVLRLPNKFMIFAGTRLIFSRLKFVFYERFQP
jgi:hypothetical protein